MMARDAEAARRTDELNGPSDINHTTSWIFNNFHRDRLLSRYVITAPESSSRYIRDGDTYCLRLAELQRFRIRSLQLEVAKEALDMYRKYNPNRSADRDHEEERQGCGCAGSRDTFHEYIQALQDYEYMMKTSGQERDMFIVSGEHLIERAFFKVATANSGDDFHGLRETVIEERYMPSRNEPIATPRDRTLRKDFHGRVGIATVGGLSLLVPMWIMVLHPTLWTGLATTTVFVLSFGVLVANYLQEGKDVVASTAAYAAVLVVFVGLNADGS